MLAQLRRSLTRVTSSVAYIPQIDGLRAMSMLLILAHHIIAIYLEDTHRLGVQHLPQDWSSTIARSPSVLWIIHLVIGVPIFCVISGFVLTVPFARSFSKGNGAPSWSLYFLRRLIRIQPPYVISMTFIFITILMPWSRGWTYASVMLHVFGLHYLASLPYLHALIYGGPSWINGVSWTLEIELQFYLVLPLLAELFRLRNSTLRRSILFAMLLASALFAQFGMPLLHSPRLDLSLFEQLHFFLAGMLLADIHLDPPRWFTLQPFAADTIVLLSLGSLVYVLHWKPELTWLEPLLIAAMFFAVFKSKGFARLFASPFVALPGTLSYTIYLYHFYLATKLLPYTIRIFPPVHALWLDALVQIALILVPTLVICAVLYLLTERPFVILSHKVASRFRPSPSAIPSTQAAVASPAMEGRP